MGPSLGIVLTCPAKIDEACRRAAGVADAALFLMDEAVRAAHEAPLRALLEAGADVSLCAMDAEAREVRALDGGPRFGSQYDHARLVRDAAEVVVLTPRRSAAFRPTHAAGRTVAVVLPADERLAAQALRAAVGYAAVGLGVTVVTPDPAALIARTEPPLARPLSTLRALGHQVAASAAADVEVAF
jgi:hypothetical protein